MKLLAILFYYYTNICYKNFNTPIISPIALTIERKKKIICGFIDIYFFKIKNK